MTDNLHAILAIAVCALVTMLLRFIPFLFFANKKLPSYIIYLGKVLPYSIMAMLVVYCLKTANLLQYPFGLPELIASLSVVVLHIYKRNTLLSIIVGTAVYMGLVQFIFIA